MTYSTDQENELSKIFIISLGSKRCNYNKLLNLAGRTVEYVPLNWPVTACVLPWFQRRFIRREERWIEGEERSEGEEKSPLVESVGNLTSMLSPSTEIEPRQ